MSNNSQENQTDIVLEVANKRKVHPLWMRITLWAVCCIAFWGVCGFLGIGSIYLLVKDDIPETPELSQYNPPLTTRMLSQSGVLLGEFAIERRDVVPPEKIPRRIVEAFIASEDDNYFNHSGIDPMGILRAALKNIRAGRIVQGGSTITQQVAKSFIGRQKTFTRKFKEAILAFRLEEKFTKEEILYLYLNQIYLGHGSYGVQAAARNYFHKNVWELSLAEMATIAGLPQAPSDYDPVQRPEAALERRTYVLTRMYEEGFITKEDSETASKQPLVADPIPDLFRRRAPYYSEEVRRRIGQRYLTAGVYEGGLKIETMVDLDWQHFAQETVNQGLRHLDHRQGYRGPLGHFDNDKQKEEFIEKLQARIDSGALEGILTIPAVVDEVSENLAKISVGHTIGVLPVFGMRWARKPDPTVHYQGAQAKVTDIRNVLKPGDIILVRPANLKTLLSGEPKSMKKVVPKDAKVFALEQIPGVQGALISVEPRLGYVRAMIGGYNFADSEFNRVLQACRQPGSTFKPIQYSLAIETKDYNPATVIMDTPVVYNDPENQSRYKPEPYERQFKGKVTVHTALINSMNLPAIKVIEDVGVKETIAWANDLGIKTPLREELGLGLGSSCVRPWEMVNVYSVFNMGGRKPKLYMIKKITDRFGRVLANNSSHKDPWQSFNEKIDRAYDRLANPLPRLISEDSNYILTHLLKGVASRGTGARAKRLGKPAAGKTGTTNDSADAWFMGFTHDIVTGVWVGHDEPKDPLGRGENGSRAALPIWLSFMQKALEERPQDDFDVPVNIAFTRIDPVSGLLARPDTPNSVLEAFKRDEQPEDYVPAQDMVRSGQFFKVDQ
jgi:penicillin-binding protein 1A